MITVLAETFVAFALGGIGIALYLTSRELGKRPICAEAVLVELLLGFVAVTVLVLFMRIASKTLV